MFDEKINIRLKSADTIAVHNKVFGSKLTQSKLNEF
jgi:hypothetical protein